MAGVILMVLVVLTMLDDVLVDKRYAFAALAVLIAIILIIDDWKDRFENKRFGRR